MTRPTQEVCDDLIAAKGRLEAARHRITTIENELGEAIARDARENPHPWLGKWVACKFRAIALEPWKNRRGMVAQNTNGVAIKVGFLTIEPGEVYVVSATGRSAWPLTGGQGMTKWELEEVP